MGFEGAYSFYAVLVPVVLGVVDLGNGVREVGRRGPVVVITRGDVEGGVERSGVVDVQDGGNDGRLFVFHGEEAVCLKCLGFVRREGRELGAEHQAGPAAFGFFLVGLRPWGWRRGGHTSGPGNPRVLWRWSYLTEHSG